MESKRSQVEGRAGFSRCIAADANSQSPKFSDQNSTDSDTQTEYCNSCFKHLENGNWYHAEGCSVLKDKVAQLQIRLLASNIRSGAHLRRIVLDAKPHLRRQVYDLIAPHVTRFKPPSYERLLGGPRGSR